MVDQIFDVMGEGIFETFGTNNPKLSIQRRRTFRLLDFVSALKAQGMITDKNNCSLSLSRTLHAAGAHMNYKLGIVDKIK